MQKGKKRLFTIPFAGGNKFSFNKFDQYLEDHFLLHHLELPGRGERITEELMKDIYEVRDDLFHQIKDKIDTEYLIYGHSLGALLGYLLILLLEEKNLRTPSRFIVSGRANPLMKPPLIRHNLSEDRFIQSLRDLGGMPSEFFDHPELFEFFEPILRADFEVVECFHFQEERKIGAPITVLHGENEFFDVLESKKWKKFTTYKEIDFHMMKGDHFFIYNHIQRISDILKENI